MFFLAYFFLLYCCIKETVVVMVYVLNTHMYNMLCCSVLANQIATVPPGTVSEFRTVSPIR